MILNNEICTTLERVFAAFGAQQPCDFAAFDDDCSWYLYVISTTIDSKQVRGYFFVKGRKEPDMHEPRRWRVSGTNYEEEQLLLQYVNSRLDSVKLPQTATAQKANEHPDMTISKDIERRLQLYELFCNTNEEYHDLQRQRTVGAGLGW